MDKTKTASAESLVPSRTGRLFGGQSKPTNPFLPACVDAAPPPAPLRARLRSMMTATPSSMIPAILHPPLPHRPTLLPLLLLLLFAAATTENPTRFGTLHEPVRPCGFDLALGIAGREGAEEFSAIEGTMMGGGGGGSSRI